MHAPCWFSGMPHLQHRTASWTHVLHQPHPTLTSATPNHTACCLPPGVSISAPPRAGCMFVHCLLPLTACVWLAAVLEVVATDPYIHHIHCLQAVQVYYVRVPQQLLFTDRAFSLPVCPLVCATAAMHLSLHNPLLPQRTHVLPCHCSARPCMSGASGSRSVVCGMLPPSSGVCTVSDCVDAACSGCLPCTNGCCCNSAHASHVYT